MYPKLLVEHSVGGGASGPVLEGVVARVCGEGQGGRGHTKQQITAEKTCRFWRT